MIEFSLYHKVLRIGLVVVAFALVFQSGIFSDSTALLSEHTEVYLANVVGVSVGVAPTDINIITAELTEQRQQLDAREAALAEREVAVSLDRAGGGYDKTTFVLASMLFILLCLIILNYALDFSRQHEARLAQKRGGHGYAG